MVQLTTMRLFTQKFLALMLQIKFQSEFTQCLQIKRLVIPDVNKNELIQGAGQLGKKVTWGLYYKTFYGCNFRIFIIIGQEPTLGASLGQALALPAIIRLGWKGLPDTNYLAQYENYNNKKFYSTGPWGQANSKGMPANTKYKQSRVTNLTYLSTNIEFGKPDCNYADCRYAECRYTERRHAEYHYAECRYAQCHYTWYQGALKNVERLSESDSNVPT